MDTKILDGVPQIVLLSIKEDLDATHASQLLKTLKELVEQGHLKIIIDLSKIDFVSSSGIGVLASTGKNLAESSGKLMVVCEREKIVSLFHITSLDRLIHIHPSIEEAQAAF